MAALTITPANMVPVAGYHGKVGIAGASILAGQAVYLDSTDNNEVKLADANASLAAAAAVGIALNPALAGQPVEYIVSGDLGFGAILTVGKFYVVGAAAAGDINPASDLTTGWYTTLLGYATTTSNLKVLVKATGAINA